MRPASGLPALLLVLALAGCVEPGVRSVPEQLQDPDARGLLLHLHQAGPGPEPEVLEAVARALGPLPLPASWRVDAVDAEARAWDTESLVRLAVAGPATGDAPGTVHLHVLWLPGQFPDERGVPLAVFVRPDPVVAVFADPLRQLPQHLAVVTDAAPSVAHLQATVLLHAAGHGLGLVDCGLPTQAPRGAHCHSDRPGSVMHDGWGHLSGWLDLARAGHDLRPVLDADDRLDLAGAAPG